MELSAGEVVEVPHYCGPAESIRGYQFTWVISALELIDIEYSLADENSIGLHGHRRVYYGELVSKDDLVYEENPSLHYICVPIPGPPGRSAHRYTLAEAYTPDQVLCWMWLCLRRRQSGRNYGFPALSEPAQPFSRESVISLIAGKQSAQLRFLTPERQASPAASGLSKGYNGIIAEPRRMASGAGGGVLYYRLQNGQQSCHQENDPPGVICIFGLFWQIC